jgi:hypothetical protein
MDVNKLELLDEWNRRATRAGWSHGQAATFCSFWHRALGVPLVICSAVVGAVASHDSKSAVIAPLSIIVAVLAGLQTFLNLSERAQIHKKASAAYANVRRSVESLVASTPGMVKELETHMQEVKETFDTLAESTPNVPGFIWRRAYKKYERGIYKSSINRIRAAEGSIVVQ